MDLDATTLQIAASFVAATAGAFLLLGWWQQRLAPMLWWAGANFCVASGLPILLLHSESGNLLYLAAGITLINLGPALVWGSARLCNARRIDLAFLFAGAALWLAALFIPEFRNSTAAQSTLNQALVAFYMFAAAAEFYDRRAEQVASRASLIVLLTLHGLFFAYGAYESALAQSGNHVNHAGLWFSLLHFETLIFVVGTSIFAVSMGREHNEWLHRIQASTDELTGLKNRRAFYREGEAIFGETPPPRGSLSVVLFDLDGFKKINDTFDHSHGDRVLRTFGETANRLLRKQDIIGRIGGEEFAAILPGSAKGAAMSVADRVRTGFTKGVDSLNVEKLMATLSAGVAEADGHSSLDALIGRADTALYRAKAAGRDRVEIYDPRTDRSQCASPSAPAAA